MTVRLPVVQPDDGQGGPPGGGANVGYTYDLRGLQTSANFITTGGGVTNAYDGFGRMTSTTIHMGGSVRTVSHQYDREGREVETTFPDGQKFWTGRDGLGRMSSGYQGPLGDTSVGMTVFYYDWTTLPYYFGRRWGSASYYEHGPSGRVSRIDQYFNTEPGRDRTDFTYNPAGQLRSETRANDAQGRRRPGRSDRRAPRIVRRRCDAPGRAGPALLPKLRIIP